MSITTTTLTGGAAVAAALSGLTYIVIQFIHPADEIASLATPMWVTVHILSFGMAVLGLVGLTGLYLHQVRRIGVLGLIGYLVFGFYFVLQSAFNFAEAFIAPLIAKDAPQLAVDFVGLFGRYPAVTDLGPLAALPVAGLVFYVGGALIFGIASVRARVLSRGSGILLIVAAALTPVASLVPHAIERLAAIPMGLALIWLGYSLWSNLQANKAQARLDQRGSSHDRTPVI